MSRNRVLGGGLHIEAVTENFTTWWQTDQYMVSAPLGSPVTVTVHPEIQDGDQVLIVDAGNNAGLQPIIVNAPEGKTFAGGVTQTQINESGGSLQLTYSIKGGGGITVARPPIPGPIALPPPGPPGPNVWLVTGDISQYTIGTFVRPVSADTVDLAVATGVADAAVGIVIKVVDFGSAEFNNITVAYAPMEMANLPVSGPVIPPPFYEGLTPGATYYLSASTPGAMTTVPPSTPTQIVQRVGFAKDATTFVFGLYAPTIVPGS